MRWRWWRTAEEQAREFAKDRLGESDATFIVSCELPDDPIAHDTAIAVRRSVAKYGMIESDYILSSDRYPNELIALSGWDSIDFVGWMLELEAELKEDVLGDFHNGIQPSFSVKDLVWHTYNYRLRRRKTKTSFNNA